MEVKELIEKSSLSFARFVSWLAIHQGEDWNWNDGRQDSPPQCRARDILSSALSMLTSLNPKAKIYKVGFESTCLQKCFPDFTQKNCTPHQVIAKCN